VGRTDNFAVHHLEPDPTVRHNNKTVRSVLYTMQLDERGVMERTDLMMNELGTAGLQIEDAAGRWGP
jgi:hypothetical protein